ncbi:MAG TPA: NAD-dependent epimerase/dehydratase family protein [Thermoanaerobaculia bacterium]|jgi:dTDP-L-rhamnose 4-epimerase
MTRAVLVTGGAGFIGSHLADALLQRGHRVRVLDNLDPQVHGNEQRRPDYLDDEVELQVGDVRDARAVERALEGIDTVFHFAAKVGVGQSMYAVENYTDVNNRGTAVLLEALIKQPVERFVVASSMSIYGEGMYRDAAGHIAAGQERTLEQLKERQWEVTDSSGHVLTPIPTPETKQPALASVYALSKFDQERLCLLVGRAYNIPTVALRFFNVYGTRQALSNPYTGVLAIFASRLLNGNAPLVNEDGEQRRDFVSVLDVAEACCLAMEHAPEVAGQAFNVGSGRNYTVNEIGRRLAEVLGKKIEPEITGKYRVGDIRHCFADISLTRSLLGYEPKVQLEEALIELAQWLEGQIGRVDDRVQQAAAELNARGLTV